MATDEVPGSETLVSKLGEQLCSCNLGFHVLQIWLFAKGDIPCSNRSGLVKK